MMISAFVLLGSISIALLTYYYPTNPPHFKAKVGAATLNDLDGIHVTYSLEKNDLLTGELGIGFNTHMTCNQDNIWEASCNWKDGTQLRIIKLFTSKRIKCTRYVWVSIAYTDVLKDCFDLDSSYWYGGGEVYNQTWPIQNNTRNESAYVTGDTLQDPVYYAGVLERFWFSSRGVAIKVDDDVPLFVSVNHNQDRRLCFVGKNSHPYVNENRTPPHLQYTVCVGHNMLTVYKETYKLFLKHPKTMPDSSVFKYPIWSTWAKFRSSVNQTMITQYVNSIIHYKLPYSFLEIDDQWETCYGDLEFDAKKFPNVRTMINELKFKKFQVSLWIHPFINVECETFTEANEKGLLVKTSDSESGKITWWNGNAGIIDITNPTAVVWWKGRLEQLKHEFNVDSFKFDAGESIWLPSKLKLSVPQHVVPNIFSTKYAEFASLFGRSVEVRLGYRTQELSLLVRILDKHSRWDRNNGLQTIIPTVLLFGVLGYPFVIPDMIGGNAYENAPSRQLYIRWIQVNTFLPILQFSLPPWDYDNEVVQIMKKMMNIRAQYINYIIDLAKKAAHDGWAIIRPVWWIAPLDRIAQVIDTEFLVGRMLLVAPIVEEGAFARDIYLPAGEWFDELRKKNQTGPVWLRQYEIRLHEIAYFTRIYGMQTV